MLKYITWQNDKTKSVEEIRKEVESSHQVVDYKASQKISREKTKEREKKKALEASQENNQPEERTQPSIPDSATCNNNNNETEALEPPKFVHKNKKVSPFFLEKKPTTNKIVELFKSRTRNVSPLQMTPDSQPCPQPQQPPSKTQPVIREKLDEVYVSIAPIKEGSNPKKRTFGTLLTNTLHTRSKVQTSSKRQAVEKIIQDYENKHNSLSNIMSDTSRPVSAI